MRCPPSAPKALALVAPAVSFARLLPPRESGGGTAAGLPRPSGLSFAPAQERAWPRWLLKRP